jgi:hypothetical protein
MFYKDRNRLISKFASSAAHVIGKNLVAAETGTWLKEHFTETLADMKYLVDDMFLSGINHVFYHGACYSPDEAGWPGWHFYASYEMNPRNSIWRDVPTLNAYVARCQAVLQAGRPDNDILLYWPIFDVWHNPNGRVQQFTVHARDWFEQQPIGRTAEQLWNRGYAFDYVSDRQLARAQVVDGRIQPGGGNYSTVVLPRTEHIPLATMRKLLELAEAGATIVFQDTLPADVPGWGKLEERRAALRELLGRIQLADATGAARSTNSGSIRQARLGKGRLFVGDVETALTAAAVLRESMFDHSGLCCVRRSVPGGYYYFIANRSEQPVESWLTLSRPAQAVVVMDPLTGRSGAGAMRQHGPDSAETFVSLSSGESTILLCQVTPQSSSPKWTWWDASGQASTLAGNWRVSFLQGGPELPHPFQTSRLASWTELGDTNAQSFAGTALYELTFDSPDEHIEHWQLDLGNVCQSARIRLNGQNLGTLITPPFRVITGPLKPKGNHLEIEVTNVTANRVRDLDRRGVKWKNFYDINFVNLDYKPFDASHWPLTDSGLLGPVTLTPVASAKGAQ